MIKALDLVAEMADWGSPLPEGTARAIALEERGESLRLNTIKLLPVWKQLGVVLPLQRRNRQRLQVQELGMRRKLFRQHQLLK